MSIDNNHEFEIIDELENDDGYFMALVPTLRDAQSEVADADEYYIFEVVEDENGEEQLCEIEDDDLLDKLAEIFETRYAQAMEEEEELSSFPVQDHVKTPARCADRAK